MAGKDLIDVLLEIRAEKRRCYEEVWEYARLIREVVRRHDPSARVLLFGSFVKGSMRPDSDIDILIITDEAAHLDRRLGLRVEMVREIGEATPFQLHIVTPAEYDRWYKRFVDRWVEV
ncbi:MAG: nucleotidyltransferase domain-containing protein [Candidatus Caldarchaeum sp.]